MSNALHPTLTSLSTQLMCFVEEVSSTADAAVTNPKHPSRHSSRVLCSCFVLAGKSSFTHVGNRRFRDAITNAIDEYNNSESRLAKSRVVQRIVESIKREGGRFLKRDRTSGGWIGM